MPKQNDNRLWFFILTVSLLLNAYFYFNKSDKTGQVLASVEDRSFRWKDVSPRGQEAFRQFDRSYYLLLKSEAEQWAENYVLPKEAGAKGVAVDELLKTEVSAKVQVAPEEVQKRYVLSPAAARLAWPEALKQIDSELRAQKYFELKKQYLKELFTRYGVRFDLEVPKSFDGREAVPPSRFPVYEPPASDSAPSYGPAEAPLLMEVYSDFYCPYSKEFTDTLAKIKDAYPSQLRIVFRHFPLPFHPGAEIAHQASVCAQEKGKFWEYHDRLMALKEKPSPEMLVQIASETGLEAAAFKACVDSGKYRVRVEEDIQLGRSQGANGTPSYLINGRLLSGALPFERLKPLLDWQLKPVGAYPGQGQDQGPARLDPDKKYEFGADWLKKGPSKGPENAPVTVVEFTDFNCPFCQKGNALSEQILAAYPGKVRLFAKNLPLPMHPNAFKTAEAALCAHEQGKYWEFRKEIFGDSWGKFTAEDMRAIAMKLKMDMSRFSACFDQSRMKPAIEEDMILIQALGSTGTPTFFVNGTPVVGAQPLENFRKLIDEKLAEKK